MTTYNSTTLPLSWLKIDQFLAMKDHDFLGILDGHFFQDSTILIPFTMTL